MLVAGAAFTLPELLDWGPQTPVCVPCDPGSLPGFDRWAVGAERAVPGALSTIVLLALGTGAEVDLLRRSEGMRHGAALAEAGAWALGLSALLKAAAGRARPVLYTDGITAADVVPDDLASFPSAHTAGAFAVATSWWLSRRTLGAEPAPWWAAALGATTVGVLRVAARRHFPSDVLAGALLGTGTAVLVHLIRF